jgi:hypothetical protein
MEIYYGDGGEARAIRDRIRDETDGDFFAGTFALRIARQLVILEFLFGLYSIIEQR